MDIEKIRNDFPMLKTKMQGHDLIYLDNGATTLKPKAVADAIYEYLTCYSGNAHRGDYDLSHTVDTAFENAREDVRRFINAKRVEEIVFTAGATDSLNMVAYGYGLTHLHEGDEIILNVAEHASNTLPWFDVAKKTGAKIVYAPLTDGCVTLEGIKSVTTDKTKIISVAIVSNVMGYVAPIKEIIKFAHEHDIIVVCDGAQSVPHHITDVIADDIDFLAFSGHKMCGPTGIGVLYGKYHLLDETSPTRYGGGSNARYKSNLEVDMKKPPYKFESGTPNIEGAIGLGAAIRYLEDIGMKDIMEREAKLRAYAIEKLKALDNITIYNENGTGAIAFNINNVFAQDGASLFNANGVAVRAGEHCAKLLDEYLGVRTTLRASFYFYNTEEEIDAFVEVCKKGDDFLDAFFG